MSEITPEHLIEMGANPADIGLSLEEILERNRRLEERIARNSDCSGLHHEKPNTSIVPSYSSAVVGLTTKINGINNSVNMIMNDPESRRRGGFVR